MAGNATMTAVSSMNAMLEPKIVAAKTQGAVFGVQGCSTSFERITPSSQDCFTMLATGLMPFSLTWRRLIAGCCLVVVRITLRTFVRYRVRIIKT